ncbi:MAG: GNAT family N-acetyltransferase [Streptosporangiaceae bacterium]
MQLAIRRVRPGEYQAVGELVLAAYRALPNYHSEPDYEADLLNTGRRAEVAEVLVAVDGDGRVLGAVTYVTNRRNEYAEWADEDAAGFRMLAVAPDAQGRGVGEALVRACIDQGRADGRGRLVLHSTPWMTTAHRLYARLGFRRAPDRDFSPVPAVPLLGFELNLA